MRSFKKIARNLPGRTKQPEGSKPQSSVDNLPLPRHSGQPSEGTFAPLSTTTTPKALESSNSNSGVPSFSIVKVRSEEHSTTAISSALNDGTVRDKIITVPNDPRPKVDLWKKAYDNLREDPKTKDLFGAYEKILESMTLHYHAIGLKHPDDLLLLANNICLISDANRCRNYQGHW